MLEITIGSLVWLCCFTVVSLSGLIITFPSLASSWFGDLFIFGKSRRRKPWKFKTDRFFLLPKRWFYHFYAVGILNTAFWVTVLVIQNKTEVIPYIAESILQIIRYPYLQGSCSLLHCYIVLICITAQVTRRFIECVTICVYSKDGKMSWAIYAVGVGFYTGLPLSCVAGTNLSQHVHYNDGKISWAIYAVGIGFYIGLPLSCVAGTNLSQHVHYNDISTHIGVLQTLGLSTFICATLVQHHTARIFANLRCDNKGAVKNDKHHIPRGGLFKYVSSPHYFAEILIYVSMATIFGFQNPMMNCLCLFVFANQFVTAYYNHKWYIETFKDYPKDRKILIPYLY